jgi:hypothetical protein
VEKPSREPAREEREGGREGGRRKRERVTVSMFASAARARAAWRPRMRGARICARSLPRPSLSSVSANTRHFRVRELQQLPGAPGKVGALDDNVWRVLLGEGLLATSLRFSELSADKSAASISVRRTGIWIW